MIPVGHPVSEVLTGNSDPVVLLALFDLDLDFVVLPKVGDLLHTQRSTFESMHPFLTPSRFIATKLLPGLRIVEPSCSCQPDTTTLIDSYLPLLHTGPWWEPCRRCVLEWVADGTLPFSCRVRPSEAVRFPLTFSIVQLQYKDYFLFR